MGMDVKKVRAAGSGGLVFLLLRVKLPVRMVSPKTIGLQIIHPTKYMSTICLVNNI
jgi:hypothetical protein